MRDQNQCAHQRGSGARSTPHAASTPPSVSFFSLFSCPYKISQQSHELFVGKQPTVGAGKPAPTSALRSFAYNYFIHPLSPCLLQYAPN